MTFAECVEFILWIEGEDSDNPNDPGGLTRFGLSQKAYPDLMITTLKREDAVEIYRRDYWNKCKCDELPEMLRLAVFDCAVNQGLHYAISQLQRCVGTSADGYAGPDTLNALMNHDDIDQLKMDYMVERLKRYRKHPKWSVFGEGWSKRLILVALR